MSDDRLSARARVSIVAAPILVAAIIVGLRSGTEGTDAATGAADRTAVTATPIEVASNAPRFATLDEMVAASDLVVLAEAVSEAPGRTVIDPLRPAVGVETRLVALRVVEVVVGVADVGAAIALEEEATLLDGTSVVVDGVAPLAVGQRGVFFLVRSTAPGERYVSLVGPQGRFLVDGDGLVGAIDDPLVAQLVAGGGPALVDQARNSND